MMSSRKRTVDAFLDSDQETEDVSPPSKKQKSALAPPTPPLHVVNLGPFPLSASEVDVRKFVFVNEHTIPCDVALQIKHNRREVYAFIAYKTDVEAQQVVDHFRTRANESVSICKIVDAATKHCQSLYDRSSFATHTRWVQLFGLSHDATSNLVAKLLKWQLCSDNEDASQVNILQMRVAHNVRYASMPGYAWIELESAAMAQSLVAHVQREWMEGKMPDSPMACKYWLDYASMAMEHHSYLCDASQIGTRDDRSQQSKQVVFGNLHWKTSKSVLSKHIFERAADNVSTLKDELQVKVIATNNGYPTGKAMVTCTTAEHARLVQSACDGSVLLGHSVFVRFHQQPETKAIVKKQVEEEEEEEGVNEVDSDGEANVVDMDSLCEDEDSDSDDESSSSSDDDDDDDDDGDGIVNGDDIDTDDLESLTDDDEDEDDSDEDDDDDLEANFKSQSESANQKPKKKFELKDKDIAGLWNWNNPNKTLPQGLLSERKQRVRRKPQRPDWLKEWSKRERIGQRDRYRIRNGVLINLAEANSNKKAWNTPKRSRSSGRNKGKGKR